MKVNWKDKELILAACDGAKSKKEILERLGIATRGASFNTLKKWAVEHGVELPDGNATVHLRDKRLIPLDKVLVDGSEYKSYRLKDRLVEAGILEDVCAMDGCGLGPEWNGMPIVLQLDHINGNHRDNRLENLRILCPNCHSQTETWGNKVRS